MSSQGLITLGFVLVAIGMFVIAYGMLRAAEKARIEGGGVVVIGPFPIAFGTSETIAKIMMAIGIILVVLFLIASLVLRWAG